MKLLLVGSSDPLATSVFAKLFADESITHVIGVDVNECDIDDPRYTHVVIDPRSAQMSQLMAGVDAVVVLGPLATGNGALEDRRAAEHVIECVYQQGVTTLVYVSSAWTYALPTRERPVTEAHARHTVPGWGAMEQAVAIEELLDRMEQQVPRVRVVRLRPALMVGRHGASWARALLRMPFTLHFAERAPRLQCVHSDDVAHAIHEALSRDVSGAFNLATSDSTTLQDMQLYLSRGWVPLPSGMIRFWWSRIRRRDDGAWLDALHHDLVLDSERARRLLRWKPEHDTVKGCLKVFDH